MLLVTAIEIIPNNLASAAVWIRVIPINLVSSHMRENRENTRQRKQSHAQDIIYVV